MRRRKEEARAHIRGRRRRRCHCFARGPEKSKSAKWASDDRRLSSGLSRGGRVILCKAAVQTTRGEGKKKKSPYENERTCFLGPATSVLDGNFFFSFSPQERDGGGLDQRHPVGLTVGWLHVLMSYLVNYGLMWHDCGADEDEEVELGRGEGGGGEAGCVLDAVAEESREKKFKVRVRRKEFAF